MEKSTLERIYPLSAFVKCDCDDWWCPRCGMHAGECDCWTEGKLGESDTHEAVRCGRVWYAKPIMRHGSQ